MNDSAQDLIDPFFGTDGGGNCLAGPYLPFGLVRLAPDVARTVTANGYGEGLPIKGFSHNHIGGTGGESKYGNIRLLPFSGFPRFETGPCEYTAEEASLGYYSARLEPSYEAKFYSPGNVVSPIRAELTCSERVGVHRYTFGDGELANLLVDIGASLLKEFGFAKGDDGISLGGYAHQISDRVLIGRGDYKGGWAHRYPYSVYFCLRSETPFEAHFSSRHNPHPETEKPVEFAEDKHLKVALAFGEVGTVNVQVGISYVSIAKAQASIEREVGGKGFDEVLGEHRARWRPWFDRIAVEGGSEEHTALFYNAFHRLLCNPSDLGCNDENPHWESSHRHFTDVMCLWDSVRNANSLFMLIAPDFHADLMNFTIDVAERYGWLPDAWIAGYFGNSQGGSNADILLAESKLKGIEGIDYERALDFMLKNLREPSPKPKKYGRHLEDYNSLGYVSTKVNPWCLSLHLEYSYQDWCTGALARELGREDDAKECFESAKKLWNLWNDDTKCFAPKTATGDWAAGYDAAKPFQPMHLDPFIHEGTGHQYGLVPWNGIPGLIQRMGGNEAFVEYLDRIFDEGWFFWKEISLHLPWLYACAGRPDLTQERVRECLEKYYHVGRRGLPDNEDMGCHSAFIIFSSMGFYPVYGQDLYLLGTPRFRRTTMTLPQSGGSLEIHCDDPSKSYIRSVELDGVALDRVWLRHSEIVGGVRLVFSTSDTPTEFGADQLPPLGSNP